MIVNGKQPNTACASEQRSAAKLRQYSNHGTHNTKSKKHWAGEIPLQRQHPARHSAISMALLA
jgi:hypothetical protein